MSFASTVFRTATSVCSSDASDGDGDFLGQRAGLEREVEGQRGGGVELHAGAAGLLEALQLGGDVVAAGLKVRERVEAAAVGDGRAGLLRLRARDA